MRRYNLIDFTVITEYQVVFEEIHRLILRQIYFLRLLITMDSMGT